MKRITLSALLMTLFLLIGCNNGGAKEGAAIKADGSVIDLKKVSTDIENAVAFAASVKEVRILVKSVDELAKAIGKKIKDADTLDTDNADHNGSLLAGAFQIISTVKTKLGDLEQTVGLPNELKQKITDSKTKTDTFLGKLKTNHSDLGKEGATDEHAKKAIGQKDGDKGAKELDELHTAIGVLVEAANDAVTSAITALTPAKAATSKDK
ncbi:outer surface protein C (plasmid) [Candidatus Borrelia fainii]|uniref:Outer surface protein C n=1 Tax=Candidatus Borrelia fainii TaxID=2518322 RepID=A0ABM8DLI2_9SPIR|nr:Vsp/OspC family lipoprotein [Candidatus Borrelia fainii]BDU63444.1 outer surface protein C [Candidatus Borrelia fainii]